MSKRKTLLTKKEQVEMLTLSEENNALRYWVIDGVEYEEIGVGKKKGIWYRTIRNNETREVEIVEWDKWEAKFKLLLDNGFLSII